MQRNKVCTSEPLSKDRFQQLLRQAWSRVTSAPDMTQLRMASEMGCTDVGAVKRGVNATNLPEAHHIFNSLCADESALREILAHYGYELWRARPEAANDLATLSGLCDVAAELSEALRDGRRVHPETLKVADKLRPHMPALTALLAEADQIRGAA